MNVQARPSSVMVANVSGRMPPITAQNTALGVMPSAGGPMGFGPGGPLPAPTPWIVYGTYLQWTGGIVVGNPTGGSLGPGTINAAAFYINGQSFELGNYLPLTGGVIGGPLTVNGAFVVHGTVDGITLDMGTY
jgi:hypothetical protein